MFYCITFVIGSLFCTLPQDEPPAKRDKIYTREEIKKLLTGKTQEEVKKLIGKPNRTDYSKWDNSRVLTWQYDGLVKDKDATETDPITQIWFGDYSGDNQPKVNRFTKLEKKR